jgi:hypothetical protein
MPITKQNQELYPENWATEIRPAILKRATDKDGVCRCEWCGAENERWIWYHPAAEYPECSHIWTQDETQAMPELEAIPLPITEWPKKKRNRYLGKLRFLGTVHAELASVLDTQRKAQDQAGFMPASKENGLLVKLALGKVSATPAELAQDWSITSED